MKNRLSIFIIAAFSVFTALLHVVIDPAYAGPGSRFVHGYMIDLILPMNAYLLAQLALRRKMTVKASRVLGAAGVFLLGTGVELAQMRGISLFGSTYDPVDIGMYAAGVCLGLCADVFFVNRLDRHCRGVPSAPFIMQAYLPGIWRIPVGSAMSMNGYDSVPIAAVHMQQQVRAPSICCIITIYCIRQFPQCHAPAR